MPESWQQHYDRLFRTTAYNQRSLKRGRMFFESVADLLQPPIVDLGCGRGLFVRMARLAGLACDGIDWAGPGADIVADITRPLDLSRYHTATCFGTLEHIPEELLDGVLINLARCPRFAVTIHNGPAKRWLGRQLHVTQMDWPAWRERLGRFLVIKGERKAWPSPDGRLRLFWGGPW
jgi:hypothetical protein